MDEPAAAEPDFCSDLPDAPAAAEPDFSLDDDALPPADGVDDPLAAEPDFCSVEALPEALPLADGVEEPLAAEPDFCSVEPEALPLADGVDEPLAAEPDALPLADGALEPLAAESDFCSVDALPPAAALPLADSEGFCSWLIEGDELEGDCCCLSCATALSDNIAAATATAIGWNFIEICSFPRNALIGE